MAFAIIENGQFKRWKTQADHPNTVFIGDMDFPEYDVFFVEELPPDPPLSHDATLADPVFEAGRWVQKWSYTPRPPEPDFDGLTTAMQIESVAPLVSAWYNGLKPVQRDPLQTAITGQDAERITARLLPILGTMDTATQTELVELLAAYNIPINLN